jgi:hypothetical protein
MVLKLKLKVFACKVRKKMMRVKVEEGIDM